MKPGLMSSALAVAAVLSWVAVPAAAQGQPARGGVGAPAGAEFGPYYQAPLVKGGPVARTPDGKADFEGYWTSRFNQAVFDVEDHPQRRPGIAPGKGAIVAIVGF